jgi:predicted  nucleic acid-binding Zn-ribbon protein
MDRLTKQLAEVKQSLTLAEAQRDDLKQKCGSTEEELKASADRARGMTALQKELSEYQEREKTLKKTLTQSKEAEQVSLSAHRDGTELMTVLEDAAYDC